MTLTAGAPSGGAVVRLESNNTDAAKVPASVTVAAGATTATFVVDTATVSTRTIATITATYAGVSRTTTLTVTLPTPRAVFTVTSPARGDNACVLISGGAELDCRLDGTASEGRLLRWMWTLRANEEVGTERTEPVWQEIDTDCEFVKGEPTVTDSNGKYINMTVTLRVTDRDATQASASKTVKLYTNANCGF